DAAADGIGRSDALPPATTTDRAGSLHCSCRAAYWIFDRMAGGRGRIHSVRGGKFAAEFGQSDPGTTAGRRADLAGYPGAWKAVTGRRNARMPVRQPHGHWTGNPSRRIWLAGVWGCTLVELSKKLA